MLAFDDFRQIFLVNKFTSCVEMIYRKCSAMSALKRSPIPFSCCSLILSKQRSTVSKNNTLALCASSPEVYICRTEAAIEMASTGDNKFVQVIRSNSRTSDASCSTIDVTLCNASAIIVVRDEF